MGEPYFSSELFDFLQELKENNSRPWFAENRSRYLRLARDPCLSWIADFGRLLRSISPHFVADPRPVGGSMFRIYRDIRFSRDKSPYKTNVAARFPNGAVQRGQPAPGFYFSLGTEGGLCGGGLWHGTSHLLNRIRSEIVQRPEAWKRAKQGLRLHGDRLKRPPRGFDAKHPLVEDLKFKDYVATISFSREQVCGERFLLDVVEGCRRLAPLVRFLCRALELPF